MWETFPTIPKAVTEINTIIKVYGPFLGDGSFTPEDNERTDKTKKYTNTTMHISNCDSNHSLHPQIGP